MAAALTLGTVTSGSAAATPERTATPGSTGPSASSGCGSPPLPGPTAAARPSGDVVQTLQVGALTRSFRLAVPTRYRRSRPTPLILLFHGSGSDALQTSLYTQLPERGARAGYLVATPDALGGQWQISPPGAHTDDLSFVAALVADLSARYCVDRTRVYAAGISLGSEFSAVAGCSRSLRIAAVGLVAAEFLLRPCAGPVPVIALHGTADPLVPYRSGAVGASFPGVPVIGVQQNLAAWARLDGCRPVPNRARIAPRVVRRTWSGCRHTSSVVLYTVVGGGHTWPGSSITLPISVFGTTTRQVDASGLILGFFGRHALGR